MREQLVADYASFTNSFVEPRDERVRAMLAERDSEGRQWPEPWISLNPSFEPGGTVNELVDCGLLHAECARIFRVKTDRSDTGLGRPIASHGVCAPTCWWMSSRQRGRGQLPIWSPIGWTDGAT